MLRVAAALGGVLAAVFMLTQIVFWSGASLGVVREHCADLESSTATRADTDSNWTYILWPPLIAANLDPTGECVRNAPLREGLDALGIWDLPPPEEQVRDHILEQLSDQQRS